jgi:molybdopterin-containing oxidoreductase family iron-sulfur binding subunit
MLRHIQVESNMSLTGANADTRIRLKPSAVNKTLVEVYNAIVGGGTSDKVLLKLLKNYKQKEAKLLFLLMVLKELMF